MLKDGKKGKEIAKDLGVSVGHVSNVKNLYETGGAAALKPKKRGRPAGKNKVLTPEQEKEIQKIIVDKTPEQLRFKECMWTRNNIRQLIKEKYYTVLDTRRFNLSRLLFSCGIPLEQCAELMDNEPLEEADALIAERQDALALEARRIQYAIDYPERKRYRQG